MTAQEKSLLLKDLCARLPYGVKVSILGGGSMPLKNLINSSIGWYADVEGAPTDFSIDEIKPYLHLMSSMTEEETYEYDRLVMCNASWVVDDWLNKNHFDYRGLIEKELALEAPEGMY